MSQGVLRGFFGATAFVGAWLLFQMQPLLGKRLLPAFGGSPSTWAACMLFFQLGLLGGYALADALVRRGSARSQGLVQGALLLLACGSLPLAANLGEPRPGSSQIAQILATLARHVGLPYLALATTSTLLQHWYARSSGRSPYVLYAASNAGSIAGLLAYPFALEPWLSSAQQASLWSWSFLGFALCMGGAALLPARAPAAVITSVEPDRAPGDTVHPARWFALAMVPSALLLAITNHITEDVAAVPLLWIAPLTLYLLSFVLCFRRRAGAERDGPPRVLLLLFIASSASLGVGLLQQGSTFLRALGTALTALFSACMLCHAELSRARPAATALSRYYLCIAAGGAAGGVFVTGLAPLLFDDFFELQIALLGVYALGLSAQHGAAPWSPRWPRRALLLGLGVCGPLLAASVIAQLQPHTRTGRVLERRRGFHGSLRVTEVGGLRVLSHGRIRHGSQALAPELAARPTAYLAPHSGVGRALRLHAQGRSRHIGVLGLGVGTLASYGRAHDRMRFYELNPDVVELAHTRFDFLRRSVAPLEIRTGDARISLARETSQRFDLLVLDTFAGDAVPTHLLTVEAFALYLRHLQADGLLLANVSNRHLDVDRVAAGSAQHHALSFAIVDTPSDPQRFYSRARWLLAARGPAAIDHCLGDAPRASLPGPPVTWTDDFSNLVRVVRRTL